MTPGFACSWEAVTANRYQKPSDRCPPKGRVATRNALKNPACVFPGTASWSGEVVLSVSLILCIDDPGAGFLGQPSRPAWRRGRVPRLLERGRAALISGRRGPAASLADSDAGAGGVATERRSGAPRAADAPGRRGHRPGLAKLL